MGTKLFEKFTFNFNSHRGANLKVASLLPCDPFLETYSDISADTVHYFWDFEIILQKIWLFCILKFRFKTLRRVSITKAG